MKKIILAVILGAVLITAMAVILSQPIPRQKDDTEVASSDAPTPANFTVSYSNEGFEPERVTIPRGTKVTFKNNTDIPLYVASDPHPDHTDYPEFDTGAALQRLPGPGEDFSFVFDKPGAWKYHNHTASEHVGVMIVE